MEKFSLYDILSVLFPGAIFLFVLNQIACSFGFLPNYGLTLRWEFMLVASIPLGALVYIVSFWLTSNCKWFYRAFGLCERVADCFAKTPNLPPFILEHLNSKTNEWYGQDLFLSKDQYRNAPEETKQNIRDMQGEFYDTMYYELDYHEKLTAPKSFQSFYIFFRNLFIISIISLAIFIVAAMVGINSYCDVTTNRIILAAVLVFLPIVSVMAARWYRIRMVYKMYWYFGMHIKETHKSNN